MKIRIKPLTKNNQTEVIDIFNYFVENSFAAYPEDKLPHEYFDNLLKMGLGSLGSDVIIDFNVVTL